MVNIFFISRQKVVRLEDCHQDIFTCCLTADARDPFLVGPNFERNLHTIHVVVVVIQCLSHHALTAGDAAGTRVRLQLRQIPTCGADRATSGAASKVLAWNRFQRLTVSQPALVVVTVQTMYVGLR